MAIACEQLRDAATRYFGGTGTKFDDSVLECIVRVCADLIALGVEIDVPDSISATIDLDSTKYQSSFLDGVLYYMQLNAMWAKEADMPKAFSRYQRALAIAQSHWDQDNYTETGMQESDE